MGLKSSNQLVVDLAPFTLPPLDSITFHIYDYELEKVEHFISHTLGKTREMILTGCNMIGREFMKEIAEAISRVKERVILKNFNFSKKQVEIIVNNSHHLVSLE
jgi:hypothetical protein